MAKINYKSDFSFLVTLMGCHIGDESRHQEAVFPPGAFRGFVSSGQANIVCEFAWNGHSCKNCRRVGESVEVFCSRHGLPPGKVTCDIFIDLPDSAFPDGKRAMHSVHDTGIELVRGNGDCFEEPLDIELIVNWALVTAYDIAVAKGGYTGSMEEFYTALNSIPDASAVLQEARETAQVASQIADSMSLLVPQEKTEEEMEQMIAEGTCVEGQIYFTPED